jgi:cell division protein FtsX
MGNVHQVEIVIHVDDALSDEQRAALVNSLIARDGVEHAKFTDGRDHLMVIDYDSNKLHSIDILDYVKKEKVGAELVGI